MYSIDRGVFPVHHKSNDEGGRSKLLLLGGFLSTDDGKTRLRPET